MENKIKWRDYTHGCLDEKDKLFQCNNDDDTIILELKSNKGDLYKGFYRQSVKSLVAITDKLGNSLEQDEIIIFSEESEWIDEDVKITQWRPYIDGSIIHEIIEYLQGTCNSLSYALEWYDIEESELTSEQTSQIDGDIFNCSCCGWWCELSEEADTTMSGEQVCEGCFDTNDEYEDEDEYEY